MKRPEFIKKLTVAIIACATICTTGCVVKEYPGEEKATVQINIKTTNIQNPTEVEDINMAWYASDETLFKTKHYNTLQEANSSRISIDQDTYTAVVVTNCEKVSVFPSTLPLSLDTWAEELKTQHPKMLWSSEKITIKGGDNILDMTL